MAGVAAWLAEAGYVAVVANYRLLPDAPYPAALDDVLTALAWIRRGPSQLAGADCDRAVALGASAGGFLAQMVGVRAGKQKVAAVVSISGPSTSRHERADGGYDCPIEQMGAAFPPVLAVHSRNDTLVPWSHARALIDRADELGVPSELYLYCSPATDHGIWREGSSPPRLNPELEAVICAFFGRILCRNVPTDA
jgi:acetyl esterase/lipase